MDFNTPQNVKELLGKLDDFIVREIKPLENQDDNIRFFDHRREHARTDWDNDGLPRKEWEELLREMRRRADKAGFLRLALPEEYGGKNIGNLAMAIIREYLAAKGLGLHNDLQNESSIVGNFPQVLMFRDFGTPAQKEEFVTGMLNGTRRPAFGLTEPKHGSDATWMETRAVKDGNGWRINGEKMWNTGVHNATHDMLFVRTSGNDGDAKGISCFLVPMNAEGVKVEFYYWTFNMPTDHAHVTFKNVFVPDNALFGPLDNGLVLARHFVHENRIRQAASSLGAGVFCLNESVDYARARKPFGKPLASNQAIQFPTVELMTQAEMLRLLIQKTAWEMDQMTGPEIQIYLSDKVSMCNYWANRFCCEAADWAMQVHGGMGYSRHKPFEHIYRHHRRYRITEGSEQIQMRNVAGHPFRLLGQKPEGGMKRVTVYDDAASFADAVMRPVAARAIANNTFLGVLERMVTSRASDHLRVAVWEGDALLLAALMTPPYVLNVADPGRGREGIVALADDLTTRRLSLPGVVSETPIAEAFASGWAARNAIRAVREHGHLLYQATDVVRPQGVRGALVRADAANIERHVAWETAFAVDIDAPLDQRERKLVFERVKRWLAGSTLFDWVVEGQAAAHGVVLPIGKDGARVLAIYTPPENRGRGYAQAMTAALTQRALEQGRWCTLFTDANNPITNKIYPRVGYRYLAEYTSFLFVPA